MSACESTDELPPQQRGDGSRTIWQARFMARQDYSLSLPGAETFSKTTGRTADSGATKTKDHEQKQSDS